MDNDNKKLKFTRRAVSANYYTDAVFVDSNGDSVTITNHPKAPQMIEVEIDGERYALWAYKIID